MIKSSLGRGIKILNKIFTEYVIKVKDEKTSLTERDFSYEPLLLSRDNEMLIQKISAVVEKFLENNPTQEAPEVTVRTKTVWQ